MSSRLLFLLALLGGMSLPARAAAPVIESVFPLQAEHAHGSTLVELSNGDLLVGWFQGSGERWADDGWVMGARKSMARPRGALPLSWPM